MALNGGGGGGSSAKDVRAGGAFWEFFGKDKVTGLLDRIQKKFNTVAGGLAKAGAISGAAGSAILAPLTALFTAGVDRTANMQKMADSLGLPIEQFSRLQHAADVAGVAVEEVMKDQARYAKLIAEAPSTDEATGRKALEVQREMARASIALKDALLPLLDVVLPVVKGFGALAKEAGPFLLAAAGVGAGLVAVGLLAGGASATMAALAVAVGVVKAGFLALVSPVGLTVAALAGIGYVLATQTEIGREFTGQVGAGLMGLVETAKTAGGGIRDALKAGDLTLAWKIGLAGLSLEWAKFTAFMTEKWNDFKKFFVDGWHDAVKLFKLALNDTELVFTDVFARILKWFNKEFGNALRKVFDAASAVHRLFGDDATADAYDTLAKSTIGQLDRALDATTRDAARRHRDNENRIEQDAAREQDARDAARAADLAGANADVARAAAELAKLVEEAAKAAERKPVGGAIPPAVVADLGKILTRGVFGGPLAQQLGAGNSFQKKQTDLLTAIRDGVGELVKNAVNLSFK